jgi:hypothetical protein
VTYFAVDQSDPENINIKTIAGEVVVTKDMLRQGIDIDGVMFRMLEPESSHHIAAEKERRESEWDEKTALGLLGIRDDGDWDTGGSIWVIAKRGEQVDNWVTVWVWHEYQVALAALNAAEDALTAVPATDPLSQTD